MSVQAHFQSLNLLSKWAHLSDWQKQALILHCMTLSQGFTCTGLSADDPGTEPITALPSSFSFPSSLLQLRYSHPAAPLQHFLYSFLLADSQLEVSAVASENEAAVFQFSWAV